MKDSFIYSESQIRYANRRIALAWSFACALLVAAVCGAVWLKIDMDRTQLIREAESEAATRAESYAGQVLRSISQIDQLSMSIKYQWEKKPGALDLEDQFRRGVYQDANYPAAIDARGYSVSSTRNLARGTYMGDLPFFKLNRDQPKSQLHILPPAPGRGGFQGKQIVRFSRRFEKSDGSFDGVVLIAAEPDYLASFHNATSLMPGDFISVRFVEGPLLVSRGGVGTTYAFFASTPIFLEDHGVRHESELAFVDRQDRLIGWQKLEGYPLISVAGISKANVFRPYASTQRTYIGIAGLVSLLLMSVAATSALNQIRNTARRRHEAQVQSTFRLAVDGAREAFYMVSSSYRHDGEIDKLYIEDCNERAAELSGYTRTYLIGKCTMDIYEGDELNAVQDFFQRVHKKKFIEDEFYVPKGRRHTHGWFHRRAVLSGKDIAITVRDITEARQQAKTLAKLAKTDTLTGLPNRHWLSDALPVMLERAHEAGQRFALLAIDLDDFKNINDALGHRTGDLVLTSVAKAMRDALPSKHHLARVGGDEFIVVLDDLIDGDGSAEAQTLMEAIAHSGVGTVWEKFPLKVSIGISVHPCDGKDAQVLMQAADIAMYEAKSQGKSQYRHYDEKYAQNIRERAQIERELQRAIQNDEFVMFYQPRANARTGQFSSMEALIRWQHPERGLVSPSEFIAIAEQTRLVIPLGELVVRKVCAQMAAWRSQGVNLKCVSVNVSALQLRDDSFRLMLSACLKEHGLHSSLIAIELTESSVLDEAGTAIKELHKLRELGIQLQIDDFGTGYSSLSQLQSLNIDVIKIDQSFVRKLGKDYQSETLCETIVSIGRSLDITVVAEGVETAEQLRKLQAVGCDEIQGYLLSKPVPAEDIPELMRHPFFEEAGKA
jgi:diguanylate cyclase (GGDEF)-like protein/PAS domain S-box-containing protein